MGVAAVAWRGRGGVGVGATASFEGVASGVTARWTAHAAAVKEDLVLESSRAVSSFVFDVDLSGGLALREQPDGGVAAVDDRGETAFVLAAPFAVDAAGVVAPEAVVRMRAERVGEAWTVRVRVTDDWLRRCP